MTSRRMTSGLTDARERAGSLSGASSIQNVSRQRGSHSIWEAGGAGGMAHYEVHQISGFELQWRLTRVQRS